MGYVSSISDQSLIVGTLLDGGKERGAFLNASPPFETSVLEPSELWPESTARGVSSSGCVVGKVLRRSDDKTFYISRPIAFGIGLESSVVLERGLEWDHCEALTLNDRGIVLIVASVAPFDTRSLVWGIEDGSISLVAGLDANVFPLGLTFDGTVLGKSKNIEGRTQTVLSRKGGAWEPVGIPLDSETTGINDHEDLVGYSKVDGLRRPWLLTRDGVRTWLPYYSEHNTEPASIDNQGLIVGSATSDHGSHAVLWEV